MEYRGGGCGGGGMITTGEATRCPRTTTTMELRRKRPPSTSSKIKVKALRWGLLEGRETLLEVRTDRSKKARVQSLYHEHQSK